MKKELMPTVQQGWRYSRSYDRTCLIEIHSARTNERQYTKLRGTGELYGPFPNRQSAMKFISDYGLNHFCSVSIRPMYSQNECIEAFSLIRAKAEGVVKTPGPRVVYSAKAHPDDHPYAMSTRARVK